MKIALIFPVPMDLDRKDPRPMFSSFAEPLGLLYLAGVLMENGYDVIIHARNLKPTQAYDMKVVGRCRNWPVEKWVETVKILGGRIACVGSMKCVGCCGVAMGWTEGVAGDGFEWTATVRRSTGDGPGGWGHSGEGWSVGECF